MSTSDEATLSDPPLTIGKRLKAKGHITMNLAVNKRTRNNEQRTNKKQGTRNNEI